MTVRLFISLAPGKKNDQGGTGGKQDRRREEDADWGIKKYKGVDEAGKTWEKTTRWFGFKLHLIVDANYELPVAYTLTQASTGEQPVMRELFKTLAKKHPALMENCEHAMGDKGYDSRETITQLWDSYDIKPIIDIRNMRKDGEPTRILESKRGKCECQCNVCQSLIFGANSREHGKLI